MAKLYSISSMLMAAIFIISASVQFNDGGNWYLWVAMYVSAGYVNVMSSWSRLPLKGVGGISKVALWQAQYSLSQVFLDDHLGGLAGVWSLDMRHKLVREKLGCILVMLTMVWQSSIVEYFNKHPTKRMNMEVPSSTQNGMAIFAGISCCLCFAFLMYPQQDLKF